MSFHEYGQGFPLVIDQMRRLVIKRFLQLLSIESLDLLARGLMMDKLRPCL
jgi:hypothetical protein